MISESINYLRESDDWVRTFLIGGVLSLLSVLVLPAFVLVGYSLRVVRAVVAGEPAPRFDDWGALLVEGFKGFVVGFAYFLLPTVVFGFAFASVIGGALSGSDVGIASAIAGAFLFVLLGVVLTLLISYVAPVGFVRFAQSGRMGDAFAFGSFRPVLFSGTYATAWVVALGVFIAAGVVVSVLSVVPVVGTVVGLFVNFYALVAAWYLYAHGVDAVDAAATTTERPAGQPVA